MRPLARPEFVIACVGNHVDSRCAVAMELAASVLPCHSIRFLDYSWLAPNELEMVTLYWVVDIEVSTDDLKAALQSGSRLLLPGERCDLSALCEKNGWQTYVTAHEAAQRIASMIESITKLGERYPLTPAAKRATAGDR